MDKSDTQTILHRQSNVSFDDKVGEYENFKLQYLNKESITFTKPVYAGFCKLELSNLIIYEWLHDEMQPFSGELELELNYRYADPFF